MAIHQGNHAPEKGKFPDLLLDTGSVSSPGHPEHHWTLLVSLGVGSETTDSDLPLSDS